MKHTPLYILLIFTLFCLSDCKKSEDKDIVPEDKFIDVLVDIHIADAVMSDKGLYDGSLKDVKKSYYHYVLKKHNLSRQSFDKSLEYYSQHGEVYVKMYDKVIDKISEKLPKTIDKKSIYQIVEKAILLAKYEPTLSDERKITIEN